MTNTLNYAISILALLVSIYAVVASSRFNRKTLEMTKNHFKKSVKPLLCVWNESFPDSFKLFLRNGGTGPAIIKNVVLKVNNKSYETMDKIFSDKSNNIDFGNYDHYETKIASIANYGLLPNGEVPLFEYHFKKPNARKEFHQLVSKVALIVNYETIYNEVKTFTEDPICKL